MISRSLGVIASALLASSGGGGEEPPPEGAKRAWRIYVFDTSDSGSFNPLIREIEMAYTVGGADLCSGGTVIKSAERGSSEAAANAFDDNTSTYWQAYTNVGEWIGYDFGVGNEVLINEVRMNAWSSYYGRFPRIGMVQSSDDLINWTTEWLFFHSQVSSEWTNYARPNSAASTHRYWGLWISNWRNTGDACSLTDIEFRSSPGGADQTSPGGTIFGSRELGGFPLSNVIDANMSSLWASHSGAATPPTAFGYDFGSAIDIQQVLLRSRESPYAQVQSPLSFDLVYSDDGKAWLIKDSFTTTDDWTAYESRTFTV